jgi:hypothetical protein
MRSAPVSLCPVACAAVLLATCLPPGGAQSAGGRPALLQCCCWPAAGAGRRRGFARPSAVRATGLQPGEEAGRGAAELGRGEELRRALRRRTLGLGGRGRDASRATGWRWGRRRR